MSFIKKINKNQKSFERIRVFMLSKWPLDADACTVISFTSRLKGEGVSTVVAGLSRTFASDSAGKTLVIEVSPGKKSISSALSQQQAVASEELPGHFTHDEQLGIDIMTLDKGTGHALNPQQINTLLERFTSEYNIILIDAGALSHSSGNYWLSNSNYRILVIDSSITTTEMLEHKSKELKHSSFELDGTILNKRVYPIPQCLYWLSR